MALSLENIRIIRHNKREWRIEVYTKPKQEIVMDKEVTTGGWKIEGFYPDLNYIGYFLLEIQIKADNEDLKIQDILPAIKAAENKITKLIKEALRES